MTRLAGNDELAVITANVRLTALTIEHRRSLPCVLAKPHDPRLPDTMAIAVLPHLIPAATIPNGDLKRALIEPLAQQRDEVIYLVCSHPRVRFDAELSDGSYTVLLARGELGGGVRWDRTSWWARLALPHSTWPSRVPWAIIDTAASRLEQLPPIAVSADDDPDGRNAQHRQDLLAWIYDRHLELGDPPSEFRGKVYGGLLDFRLEYVGSSTVNALRRPAGAHHKVPVILGRILLYEPHRLVYVMPCEVRVGLYNANDSPPTVPLLRLGDAVEEHGVGRKLLVDAAEEALIAAAGTSYNKRNAVKRRFPDTASGDRLAACGVRTVHLGFSGLPERFRIGGTTAWDRATKTINFDLGTPQAAPHGRG